jgi:glutamine cyclotransferase
MNDIRELNRRRAPFERPQSITFNGQSLWVGSIATETVYELDPATLAILRESVAPGKPWGMTSVGDELRVICGEPPDDNRFIRKFVPEKGFDSARVGCPDDTGSQLSYDGQHLFVSQWYNRQILEVDDTGRVKRAIDLPHQICGQTFANDSLYALTTEDESTRDYWITRISQSNGTVRFEDVAHVPFHARALAFDGQNFWTNHREAHEIVTFAL